MTQIFDLSHGKPALILLVIVSVCYFVISRTLTYRKLRQFPGPFLASFSELWLFNVTAKGDLYLSAEQALRKYGSPCRIGPNMILTDDPEFVRFITAPRSPFRRGHWYKGMKFDPRIDNILSERDEKRHNELRAKLMPGYTAKEVPALESKIDARVLDLVNYINKYIERKQAIDFATVAQYFTLDSLTDIAFGYPLGFLTSDTDLYSYNKSSTEFFPIMEVGTNIPLIHTILSSRLMQFLAGPKPEDKAGLGAIIGVAQSVVSERFNPDSKPSHSHRENDMLDAFIRHGLTQLEAESESLLQILAGSDSTATTIRVTMLYILTNPPVYIKIQSEVDTAIAAGSISHPVVSNTEAVALPYLQACIKEGLRLWQPLNGLQTKISPAEPVTINGVYIPGHTQVTLSQHNMMRRTDLFGTDAEVFRPERWIEGEKEVIKGYERVWELSFASGRFTCLGKGLALMEVGKVFVELFRRFEFGLVNPVRTVETKCHQLHVQRNMNVSVWARSSE